jgi:tetratricopeptide (TPR) repeat protein
MGAVSSARLKRVLPYLLTTLIVLMIVSSYSNTFTSPPYLDDFHSFVYEKALHLNSVSISSLLSLYHTKFGWTRFLPVITLALNISLGQSKLIYFHAVNLLIHLSTFFAVFWLVSLIVAATKNRNEEKPIYETSGYFALCVAAIWALSPVQTSSVTYLVQRMASMQALFFTLSTACFIKARLPSCERTYKASIFYFLCALSALCAFLSKENSATLPVALIMIDIWFFDCALVKKAWGLIRKTGWKVRMVAVSVLVSSSFIAVTAVWPKILTGYAHRDFNLVERLLTEGRVVVWYMSILLWPVPSRLSMVHDFRISNSLFSPFSTLPALIVVGALIFFALKFRKRFPIITFGTVWFFLNLVIESTIIPLELVFEHRLYLPSVGFYLSVVAIFMIFLRKAANRISETEFTKAACSFLFIVASCLAIFTFIRNDVWEDKVSIHYDAVKKTPDSSRANADLANTLCDVGRYEEALKYGEKALELSRDGREDSALAMNAIIMALKKLGRTDEAIKRGEQFVEEKANSVDANAIPHICLNIAQICLSLKEPEGAYKWALKALDYVHLTDDSFYKKSLVEIVLLSALWEFGSLGTDLTPCGLGDLNDLPLALQAAAIFRKLGDEGYAREIIEREYMKNPNDPHVLSAFENIRKMDAQNIAQKEKWNSFQKYVRDPFSRFNFDMAVAYLVQEKQLPEFFRKIGERRLDEALEISPGSRDARLLKGWYLYNTGDADHAVETARKALDGDPENSNTWLALGFFLAKAGDNDGAVAAFEKVIELYPGYSKRSIVEQICSQLKQGKPIESASAKGAG